MASLSSHLPRLVIAALAAALLFGPPVAAQEALDAEDLARCAEVLPHAQRVLEADAAPTGKEEHARALMGAGCLVASGRLEDGYRLMKLAQRGEEALFPASLLLLLMTSDSDDLQVQALEVLAEDPEGMRSLPFEAVAALIDDFRTRARPLHRRALLALRRGGFGGSDPAGVGVMTRDLAVYAAEVGDAAGLALSLRRLEDADLLLQVRLDRRFAAAVAAAPEHYDLRGAVERRLAVLRSARRALDQDAPAEPLQAAEAAAEAAQLLSRLGRGAEALSVLEEAQRKDPGPLASPRYTPTLQAARGRVLWDLGRLDEAERAFADIEPGLEDAWDVDYGAMAVRRGRLKEALEALHPPGQRFTLRATGRGVVARRVAQRACALAASGDANELAEALATLDEHARDTSAHAEALLCAGEHAAVRDSYLRRLRDPLLAGAALAALSTYRTAAKRTGHETMLEARLAAIRADLRSQPLSPPWGGRRSCRS